MEIGDTVMTGRKIWIAHNVGYNSFKRILIRIGSKAIVTDIYSDKTDVRIKPELRLFFGFKDVKYHECRFSIWDEQLCRMVLTEKVVYPFCINNK